MVPTPFLYNIVLCQEELLVKVNIVAIIKCQECGAEISDKAKACPKCGYPMGVREVPVSSPQFIVSPPQQPNETVVVVGNQSNGLATAGFVMSILGLVLGWIPVVGWFIWFLGFVLCFFGLFYSPRGMAIVGLVITFIDVIIFSSFVGLIVSALSELFPVLNTLFP